MGRLSPSYELLQYATRGTENVKHILSYRCNSDRWMSNIFFHTDVTLTDGSTLQGGEWPGVPWYPDMPETGAALQDLSWLIKICEGLFPRVRALQDFPYPS